MQQHGIDCLCCPVAAVQSISEIAFAKSACAAASVGDYSRVKNLLNRNSKALENDGAGGNSGFTPLHYAARGNHINVVQLLLDRGASPSFFRDFYFLSFTGCIRSSELTVVPSECRGRRQQPDTSRRCHPSASSSLHGAFRRRAPASRRWSRSHNTRYRRPDVLTQGGSRKQDDGGDNAAGAEPVACGCEGWQGPHRCRAYAGGRRNSMLKLLTL
jgi:hypothetical protein